MPKRTNDFQKLVKIINMHLSPSGAKITESAMLYDLEAETNREVDILVEVEYLNCPIKIGIECTEIVRPADIKIIEGLKEKHRKIGIQQTIVVSKNGFTGTAKKYAAKNNIKLLTFGAARKEQWTSIYERLKGLSMYGRTYFLRSISLNADTNKTDPNFQMSTSVLVRLEEDWIPVAEYAGMLFKLSNVSELAFKELKENEENSNNPWLKVGFNLDNKVEFKDIAGRTIHPQELIAVFGYRSKYRDLNIGEISYDGKELVAGGFYNGKNGEAAHIAIDTGSGNFVGTMEISGSLFPSTSEVVKYKPEG
ncbi:hypothetical protein [Aeromonas hydrophila]|uniref:hypothetical protein n=1 Tax=Aeromonas hydrophila TaxID=644 RepID=UPI002B472F73|nr:hypothetical protein [Aeromonas hydrophila]